MLSESVKACPSFLTSGHIAAAVAVVILSWDRITPFEAKEPVSWYPTPPGRQAIGFVLGQPAVQNCMSVLEWMGSGTLLPTGGSISRPASRTNGACC